MGDLTPNHFVDHFRSNWFFPLSILWRWRVLGTATAIGHVVGGIEALALQLMTVTVGNELLQMVDIGNGHPQGPDLAQSAVSEIGRIFILQRKNTEHRHAI